MPEAVIECSKPLCAKLASCLEVVRSDGDDDTHPLVADGLARWLRRGG